VVQQIQSVHMTHDIILVCVSDDFKSPFFRQKSSNMLLKNVTEIMLLRV
jgi:hypothetical protein